MENQRIRAALIGGGFAGRTHVGAIRAAGAEPCLIITTREETAKRFAEEMGIPRWSGADKDGYAAALAPDIDVVHVCTPPSSHAKIVYELLRHGKNVLCEKPIALDLAEADMLVGLGSGQTAGGLGAIADESEQSAGGSGAAADSAGQTAAPLCALTYNVRFHMACQRAKELIRSGVYGRPILIHGSYTQEFHALPAPYDWRYDPALGGSMRAITEIGSHWIDLAQYLTGLSVCAVSADKACFWPEREIRDGIMTAPPSRSGCHVVPVRSEDAACVNLRFDNGAIGSVVLSEVSPGRGNHLAIEITCENGNLWWNEEDNNILYTARKGEGIHAERFPFGNGFGDTFEELIRRFYESVRSRKEKEYAQLSGTDKGKLSKEGEESKPEPIDPELPLFSDGLQVAKVCCAMGESAAKDGAWVRVL